MGLRFLFTIPVLLGVGVSVFATARAAQQDDTVYELVSITAEVNQPLYLTHAGDERLFVIEQAGRIRIIEDGELAAQPYLDVIDLVNDNGREQGLLGMAFDPDYATNGRFYINYTSKDSTTRIERYQVSDDPNLADLESVELILEFDQPFGNHNGGNLVFGPDGYLYIGTGDGGSGGDPNNNAQNLGVLLGKMLRVDVSGELPYEIPRDNPFVDDPDARPEIWAYGLRNPWRFSFDTQTDDLYIADVGQNNIEEINFQAADSPGGENYGWRFYEGSDVFRDALGDREPFVFPIYEYSHNLGCSVTGGYVYRGDNLPDLQGSYFYGDYCAGIIWRLHQDDAGAWQNEIFLEPGFNIASFGEDVDGELYVVTISPPAIWMLRAAEGG
jgi:glucose/arabinose dehydrogenase